MSVFQARNLLRPINLSGDLTDACVNNAHWFNFCDTADALNWQHNTTLMQLQHSIVYTATSKPAPAPKFHDCLYSNKQTRPRPQISRLPIQQQANLPPPPNFTIVYSATSKLAPTPKFHDSNKQTRPRPAGIPLVELLHFFFIISIILLDIQYLSCKVFGRGLHRWQNPAMTLTQLGSEVHGCVHFHHLLFLGEVVEVR